MTFGQLNTFLALARAGSVRGAAAALVVTEPAGRRRWARCSATSEWSW